MKLWYNAVVEAQEFFSNDIRSQYVIRKKIGETKSGRNIYKAQHIISKIVYAVRELPKYDEESKCRKMT